MNTFQSSQSIGEIVAIMPKASDIFKEYQIDFCCGGHRPLVEAITKQGLKEEEILDKLDQAYEEMLQYNNQIDFRTLPSGELIDYIINTHHVFVRRILPEISDLTTTILRVHGSSHRELFVIHKLFHSLKMELEQHLIKEEEILFPMIKEYEVSPSEDLLQRYQAVMKETEEEHDGAGDILKELRVVTNDFTAPEDGCGTYERTYERLFELESDLFQHIHLENNILFQRF